MTPSYTSLPNDDKIRHGDDSSFTTSERDSHDINPLKRLDVEELPLPGNEKKRSSSNILNTLYISLNVASTIALTLLNKIVLGNDQLQNCQISFAAYHFSMTFFVLTLATLPPFRLFQRVRLPLLSILPLCILFNAFLILGNLSLQHNDVAFYTLARLLTCPTVVFLNLVLFRQTVTKRVLSSVIILTLGVMVANGKFGLAHPLGLGLAVAAFVVTALYQILIQRKVGELGVSPPQLLFNQAPVAVILLLVIVPVFDKPPKLDAIPLNVWIALFASGCVAALFNISQFLIIGATSALTFNVMGMAKVVGNLSIGWLIAGRLPTFIEVAGVMLAMSGTWLYATANNTAKKAGEVEREGLLAEDTRDIGLDQLYPFREEEESAGEGEGEERAGDVKVAERAGDVKAEGRVELPDPNMFTEGGKEDDLLISEPVLSR